MITYIIQINISLLTQIKQNHIISIQIKLITSIAYNVFSYFLIFYFQPLDEISKEKMMSTKSSLFGLKISSLDFCSKGALTSYLVASLFTSTRYPDTYLRWIRLYIIGGFYSQNEWDIFWIGWNHVCFSSLLFYLYIYLFTYLLALLLSFLISFFISFNPCVTSFLLSPYSISPPSLFTSFSLSLLFPLLYSLSLSLSLPYPCSHLYLDFHLSTGWRRKYLNSVLGWILS